MSTARPKSALSGTVRERILSASGIVQIESALPR